jgi:hypothetical protein
VQKPNRDFLLRNLAGIKSAIPSVGPSAGLSAGLSAGMIARAVARGGANLARVAVLESPVQNSAGRVAGNAVDSAPRLAAQRRAARRPAADSVPMDDLKRNARSAPRAATGPTAPLAGLAEGAVDYRQGNRANRAPDPPATVRAHHVRIPVSSGKPDLGDRSASLSAAAANNDPAEGALSGATAKTGPASIAPAQKNAVSGPRTVQLAPLGHAPSVAIVITSPASIALARKSAAVDRTTRHDRRVHRAPLLGRLEVAASGAVRPAPPAEIRAAFAPAAGVVQAHAPPVANPAAAKGVQNSEGALR